VIETMFAARCFWCNTRNAVGGGWMARPMIGLELAELHEGWGWLFESETSRSAA